MDQWLRYRLTLFGLTPLCGSIPCSPEGQRIDVIQKFAEQRAKRKKVLGPEDKSAVEIQEEVAALLYVPESEPEITVNSFLTVPGGGCLAVEARTIKAHLKDKAGDVGRYLVGRIEKQASLRTKVAANLQCDHSRPPAVFDPETFSVLLPITRESGEAVAKPDKWVDKFVHTYQVNALKRFAAVYPWRVEAPLSIACVKGKLILSQDDLEMILNRGGMSGYAGERSEGYGRYSWKLERDEEAEAAV